MGRGGRANERAADVQESAPTTDQLSNILEYLGPAQAGTVIADATSTTDALKKFKANENSFKAPVTVDWMNARAGTSNESPKSSIS